jgi:hypothetical protein
LLEEFNSRGHEFTWNASGTIFIDQISIPNTNFFKIFPLLFKVKKTNVSGLLDTVNKIHSMGLSHLIKQKFVEVKDTSKFSDANTNPNWWFLGP